jgi:hypothetical protein
VLQAHRIDPLLLADGRGGIRAAVQCNHHLHRFAVQPDAGLPFGSIAGSAPRAASSWAGTRMPIIAGPRCGPAIVRCASSLQHEVRITIVEGFVQAFAKAPMHDVGAACAPMERRQPMAGDQQSVIAKGRIDAGAQLVQRCCTR